MSAHTPEPWKKYGPFSLPEFNGRGNVWTVSAENDSRLIAEIYTEANATLIAAAPDLLIACTKAYAVLVHMNPNDLGPGALDLVKELLNVTACAEGFQP